MGSAPSGADTETWRRQRRSRHHLEPKPATRWNAHSTNQPMESSNIATPDTGPCGLHVIRPLGPG